VRACLFAGAFAAGLAIAAHTLIGPFDFPVRVTTPLNPEGWLGLAVTVLLATGAGFAAKQEAPAAQSVPWRAASIAALAGITAAVFWPTLHFCFLGDDFVLVNMANKFHAVRLLFTTPGGDGFFRPVGYVSLLWTSAWAGVSPAAWHAAALALHAFNVALVFLLATRLSLSRTAAFFAAALFAIHGTRPEAVTWIAGRFDLLASFFILAGLLLFVRSWGEAPRTAGAYKLASLVLMALGCLSKETAFVFPFLLVLVVAEKRVPLRKKATILTPFFVTAAALFAYRCGLLGGIGGYRNSQTGQAQALAFGLPTLKALAVRLWTALYFPINWSSEPGAWLRILTIAYLCALAVVAAGRPNRRLAAFGLGFLLVSGMPALQGFGFGPTLEGGRLLYLPSVGFCLMLAAGVDGIPGRSRWAALAAILLFHLAALQHNLNQWERVSGKTRAAAVAIAQCVEPGPRKIVDFGVPARLNGVPFLGNANPEQIAFVLSAPGAKSTGALVWNRVQENVQCSQ
jgi:hypothetical protein